MKKLLLIRHAKAEQDNYDNDFERALTHSGLHDAAVMAQRLYAEHIIPQFIVTSPALRAESTANIFAQHLSLPQPQTDMLIYEAKKGDLMKVINGLPDKYEFVALAGHNPDISRAIITLTGEGREVPTCAVALVLFELDSWAEVSDNLGTLLLYDEP